MSSDPDRIDDAVSPPPVPSAWTIERVISAVLQLQSELSTDEELIEDETVVARALLKADAAKLPDALAALIDGVRWAERRAIEAREDARIFTERARRYEAHDERFRDLISRIMEVTGIRKAASRLARASIVRAPPSVLVTDEGQIPGEYFKVERTLRRSDLLSDLKVGVVVDGAVLSNGGETLRIERLK